jgi:WD40 repeat protein
MAKPSLKAKDDDMFSLMEKTEEFLASERQVMLVLGDSGAGKSTFNRHLEHRLWNDYKPGNPIPLFINLPAIDRPDQDMVAKQLRVHSFSEEQIMEIKLHRRLILICDGYDESQQLVNLHRTNMLNQPGQWNVKMIISCRTQFLGPDYHSRFVPQVEGGHYDRPAPNRFQEAVIAPFSKAQIEHYVEQYVPLEPRTWLTQDYMDRLTTIPNLLDLVKNPFLLSLSLEALPGVMEGKQDMSTINITRVHLYDIFVKHWLDINKRRLETNNALSMDDRNMLSELVSAGFTSLGLDYSTRLAQAIFDRQDGNPVVKYVHLSDKNSWRAEFFGPQPEIRLLRESSPLTRTGNQFRFVHRSMLEYFLSRAIYSPVKADDEGGEEDDDISSESSDPSLLDHNGPLHRRYLLSEPSVILFLCDRVKSNPDFEQRLRFVIDQSKTDPGAAIAATNAITILVRAGVSFHYADLRGVKIPGADLSEGQFDSAQLQGAELAGANLSRCWLRQADLSNAQLDGVQFGELPYLETDGSALACAYSPDGKMIAVGLENDGFDIFETNTWKRVFCIRGIKGVRGIVFSPDGRQVVSGGDDSTVRLWDCTSWSELQVMKGHLRDVHSVACSPCGKRVASASRDSTVRLWDTQTGENHLILRGHNMGVESIMFSPDGLQIVSGGYDKTIRFWDSETGEPRAVLSPTFSEVYGTAFSPDGRWIASGHKDSIVRIWDAVSGEQGPVLIGHTSVVTGLSFSPNGQRIASSSNDHSIRLWDASTGAPVSILTGHNTAVWSVAFSPDGLQLASGGDDNKVRLWEVNSNWTSVESRGQACAVWKAAYSLDGQVIVSHHNGYTVQQWNSTTGGPLPPSIKFSGSLCVGAVTFSPDGSQIATAGDDCVIRLWDRQTGAVGAVLDGHQERVSNMAYSPCGSWLIVASWSNIIRLWELHDNSTEQQRTITQIDEKHNAAVCSMAFSSTGRWVAVGSVSSQVRLFDPRSGEPGMSKTLVKGIPRALNFSPDGQQLAIGVSNNSIYLWNVGRSEAAVVVEDEGFDTELDGHSGEIFSVAYSPCGQWIASGSGDRTVRLWHRQQVGAVESWPCITTIRSFFNIVYSVAWNPVHPMEFVTACLDGSIRVWRKSGGHGGDGVVYGLLWGTNTGMLCTEGLVLNDAAGLSPIHQKLLVQRGAAYCSQVPEENSLDVEVS